MLYYKIFFTVLVTLFLIFISEKKPRIGGLISGLPIGTGIVIYFFSLEHGYHFVLQSIPYGIIGLSCSLFFCLGFYLGGRLQIKKQIVAIAVSFAFGIFLFTLLGYLLSFFNFSILSSSLVFLISVVLSIMFYSKIPNKDKTNVVNVNLYSILFRIFFITIIILLITGFPKIIGVKWSGIFASFPSGLSSVLIILSYTYKNDKYPIVIKFFSYSITTLLVFYLSIIYIFQKFNLNQGFIITYLVCILYVWLLNKFLKKIKQ